MRIVEQRQYFSRGVETCFTQRTTVRAQLYAYFQEAFREVSRKRVEDYARGARKLSQSCQTCYELVSGRLEMSGYVVVSENARLIPS